MRLLVRSALLCFLALPVAAVTPNFLGDRFPLTDTRYGATPGIPALATNGNTLVLAWATEQSVRAARLIDGKRITGEYVLPTYGAVDEVAIVWTGTNFLVASSSQDDGRPVVAGRLLDPDGKPLGAPFVMANRAREPRLASNGSRVVLMYRDDATDDVYSRPFLPNGNAVPNTLGQKIASRTAFGPLYDIATNGSDFQAIVSSPVEVSLARFGTDGVFQSTRFITDSQGTSRPRPAAIAGNGTGYLLTWFDAARTGIARYLDASGSLSAPLEIDSVGNNPNISFLGVKAVWSGSDWAVSYVRTLQLEASLRVAHLSSAVSSVTSREIEMPVSTTSPAPAAALVRHGGAVRVAWNADRLGDEHGLVLSTLPLSPNSGALVTFDAPDQRVLGGAGRAGVSVFLWNESSTRNSVTWLATTDFGGPWLEVPLALAADSAIVSAGDGFLVVVRHHGTSIAFLLDTNGVPYGDARSLDFHVTSVAWNGFVWALAGERDTAVVVAEMNTLGVVSPAKEIQNLASAPRIASDGDGFLMVWLMEGPCGGPCIPPTVVRGARLDAQRVRLDDTNLDLGPASRAEFPAVAWNPERLEYLAGWIDDKVVMASHVPPQGPFPPATNFVFAGVTHQSELSMLEVAGDVAVTWRDGSLTRLTYVDRFGNPVRMFELPHPLPAPGAPQLVNVLDRAAVLFSEVRPGAPHYGASRLMLAVTSDDSGHADQASLVAELVGPQIRLAWTNVDKTIMGHRIEYRIGEGPWLELTEFFPRGVTSTNFAVVGREPHAFRARAFGTGGPSSYSNEVTVRFPSDAKRRAVRK